jgi:hypothetical protein
MQNIAKISQKVKQRGSSMDEGAVQNKTQEVVKQPKIEETDKQE